MDLGLLTPMVEIPLLGFVIVMGSAFGIGYCLASIRHLRTQLDHLAPGLVAAVYCHAALQTIAEDTDLDMERATEIIERRVWNHIKDDETALDAFEKAGHFR